MIPAADCLERCLSDIDYWMFANPLKLNADKTELLWAGSKHAFAVLGSSGPSLCLRDTCVFSAIEMLRDIVLYKSNVDIATDINIKLN